MSIRVILADDHSIVREGLRMILGTQKDIQILAECADGRDAVRLVEQWLPDVVVMDISMPGLNGIDAVAKIHDSAPQVKAVILSMHCSSEHVSRALRAGAQGYVLKESAGAELLEALRMVAGGGRYLSRRVAEMMAYDHVRRNGECREIAPLDSLSIREREVLCLIKEGKSNSEIAARLSLSEKTVSTYRSRIMEKLGVANAVELIRYVLEQESSEGKNTASTT